MKTILIFAQIIVSLLLIIMILLQRRGQALGSAFGGGGEFFATRRGMEKKIFWLTIILGVLFIILAVSNLIV